MNFIKIIWEEDSINKFLEEIKTSLNNRPKKKELSHGAMALFLSSQFPDFMR